MSIEKSEDKPASPGSGIEPKSDAVSPPVPAQGSGTASEPSAMAGGAKSPAEAGPSVPKRRRRHVPQSVELPDVEPWPEPVNGVELLNSILEHMERFVP